MTDMKNKKIDMKNKKKTENEKQVSDDLLLQLATDACAGLAALHRCPLVLVVGLFRPSCLSASKIIYLSQNALLSFWLYTALSSTLLLLVEQFNNLSPAIIHASK